MEVDGVLGELLIRHDVGDAIAEEEEDGALLRAEVALGEVWRGAHLKAGAGAKKGVSLGRQVVGRGRRALCPACRGSRAGRRVPVECRAAPLRPETGRRMQSARPATKRPLQTSISSWPSQARERSERISSTLRHSCKLSLYLGACSRLPRLAARREGVTHHRFERVVPQGSGDGEHTHHAAPKHRAPGGEDARPLSSVRRFVVKAQRHRFDERCTEERAGNRRSRGQGSDANDALSQPKDCGKRRCVSLCGTR